MAPVTKRRFVRDATLAGWRQLVELSNQIGALLLVLLLLGLSVGSGYALPHWWIGLIVFAAGYFLLFAEGCYQMQRGVTARVGALEHLEAQRNEKPTVESSVKLKHDVRYGRTMRASWKNTSPQDVPAGELYCIQVPASWGVEIDGNTWQVAHGDDVHNIHQPGPYRLQKNMAVVHDIHIPVDVHGPQKITLLIAGIHEQEHEIDVDA